MRSPRFVTMSFTICQRKDLTPAEKLILARIAGFDDYFESAEKCAENLGYAPNTVRKIKQKLEKMGFITSTSNTGRGKHYVASEEFRVQRRKRTEKPKEPTPTPQVDTSMLRPVQSTPRTRRDWDTWKEKNKDLIPVLDRCMNFLSNNCIPVVDPKALRRGLAITADLFRSDTNPHAHIKVLNEYIDYLESPQYAYQVEHTKYCPRITSQYDLFGKFSMVRDFKWDESRHYDPRKTLTR